MNYTILKTDINMLRKKAGVSEDDLSHSTKVAIKALDMELVGQRNPGAY